MGIAGANLRVLRQAKVFREEVESETKEGHLTCPPNVLAYPEEGTPQGGVMTPRTQKITCARLALLAAA